MDELLYERVKQLKLIDERLEFIVKRADRHPVDREKWALEIDELRRNVQRMIFDAEEAHARF